MSKNKNDTVVRGLRLDKTHQPLNWKDSMKRFTAEFPVLMLIFKNAASPANMLRGEQRTERRRPSPISLYITLTLSTYESIQEHQAQPKQEAQASRKTTS